MPTVSPIIATPDLPRLESFYTGLLDATVAERYPEKGPTFFVGLRIGNSHLGLVADGEVGASASRTSPTPTATP